MALASTYQRLGEPVVVACGPSETSGGLQVGLLFVQPQLSLERVTLRPISDPDGKHITVIWPPEYRDLLEAKRVTNVTLEVARE